jgi:hypothetical protein
MLNDTNEPLYKDLKLLPKFEELSSNDLRLEYRRLLFQHVNKEKELSSLREMYQELQDDYTNLEKKNSELMWEYNHYLNNDKITKELNDTIELITKEKEKIIEEANMKYRSLKEEKDAIIRKLEEQLTRLKVSNDIMATNLESINSFKVMRNTQELLIKDLEENIEIQRETFQKKMDSNQFHHEIKYSDLKKKMKEKIEKTKKNVEQLSYEYVDSSYKLNILQNSQLLTQIDHLKKEIQEIQLQKEKNDKLIFELNKDIVTHQEVENQLALKNKNYLEIIKNLSSKLEGKPLETHFNKSHFNSSCENSIISYNNLNTLKKENYISLSKSQIFRKDLNTLNHSLYLERKMSKIEEELNHKKKDFDILKINYDNLGCKYKEIKSKINNVVILLIEGLNRLSGIIGPNSIELNEIKNYRFQDLSSETKHALLTQLLNNFLPIFNDNTEKFTRLINYSPEVTGSKNQKTIVDTIKRMKSNSQLGVPIKLTLKSMNKLF